MDIRSEAFKGGELYDASIIAGSAATSPLFQFVADEDADLRMPPEGDRLPAADMETLRRWIDEGAHWPEGVDTATLQDPRDHWSFKPVSQPPAPATTNSAWPRNDIDRFVLARLEEAGLSPAPAADPVIWLRRVSLDLTGLPPTLEQVNRFVTDDSGHAAEDAVERLLASPRYGERWAQHWLDVVRYADTHGFEVNTERPHAWPYRDYVIQALNDDVPYDRFIEEQIVGDTVGQDAATGFLVTASVLLPGQIGQDEPSKRLARQDSLDEILINISHTFLGISIGCARCHSHKFDPISQREYYSMQAFVAGVEYGDRELITADVRERRAEVADYKKRSIAIEKELADFIPLPGSGTPRPMLNAKQNIERLAPVKTRRLRFTIRATNQLEPCIDELEVFNTQGENIALASLGTKVTSSGDNVTTDRHELRFVNDGNYGNSRSWMSSQIGQGWVELEFPDEHEIDRVVWGRDREGQFADRLAIDYAIEVASSIGDWKRIADSSDRMSYSTVEPSEASATNLGFPPSAEPLIRELAQWQAKIAEAESTPMVFAGQFRKPDEIHLLTRGDPEQPKELVNPAVPAALGSLRLPMETHERERRQELARWIADPENPLTARVLVNRIWQKHFGTGLVETPNDFGHSGQPPSHPELLDWLASEFVRNDWSIKHLHRLIVLSATYRQSSRTDEANFRRGQECDADVRLLWQFPSRRIDAETIRDAMLAVSGELHLTMYGRGFDLFDKRGGLEGFQPVEHFEQAGLRRMIYAHKIRRERDAVFGAFDCPDGGQSTAARRESTTPIQALNLMNSPFTLERAEAFAARVTGHVGTEPTEQIRYAYRLALTREPSATEIEEARSVVEEHGLATLCRVLFNCNEALFLP